MGRNVSEPLRCHLPFTLVVHCPLESTGEGILDLNYLFHRQQVERSRAASASSEEARAIHELLARQYEAQIEKLTAEEFSIATDQTVAD